MRRVLLGVESEYAVSGLLTSGASIPRAELVSRMMDVAKRSRRHLREARGDGIFLDNGARLYVDAGEHPEFATPECQDPWEVVRYIRAGERLLWQLATTVREEIDNLAVVIVLRSNVDYKGATWGCHESYLHRAPPSQLPAQLIPHLVSRVVYTGAGGFRPGTKFEFTLSPRASHLTQVASAHSTRDRGIYHEKNETLSRGGYNRLHVLCGESLCSDTASVLKLGATALIVAAIDADRIPGASMMLESPLAALKTFASDPTCTVTVPLADGRCVTALDVQRHYLAEVRAANDRLPKWAPALCDLWQRQLDALAAGPDAMAKTLDWGIKWSLYEQWASRRGASRWSGQGFSRHAHLTRELLEIDLRFGQLGGHGVFDQLDDAGKLDHRLIARDDVTRALDNAPTGRAGVRGGWVRQLGGEQQAERYACTWTGIHDRREARRIDLSNPFATAAEWQSVPVPAAMKQMIREGIAEYF
jgi:proteasome accessory factor A